MFKKILSGILSKVSHNTQQFQQPSRNEENWISFKRYSGNDYVLILIDLRFVDDSPKTSMSWFELMYSFNASQLVNGWMPTPEVMEDFYAFEDVVEQKIKLFGGHMAACQTGAGIRKVLYCAPTLKFAELLREQVNGYSNIPVSVRSVSYDQLASFLPTQLEDKLMHDEKIMDSLLKHGDDGSAERKVMYWFTDFRAHVSPDLPVALESLGYNIEEIDTEFVRFSAVKSLYWDVLREDTETLITLGEQFACTYDGWETPVVRPTTH